MFGVCPTPPLKQIMFLNLLQFAFSYITLGVKKRNNLIYCKNIAVGAVGHKFDFRTGQIEPGVANGSPPLQRFFEAVLPRR